MLETLANDYWQLTIPLVAGVIGWFTNMLAIKMMFYPIEFVGLKPFLGWQGIIPSNAVRLAQTGLELVTSSILSVPDLFKDFDAEGLVASESDKLNALVRSSLETKAQELFPQMWGALSPQIREQVFAVAESEIQKLSVEVFEEAASEIEDLIDIRRIITEAVQADKSLMNETFLRVGKKEFQFIEYSGFWFGLLFGVPQLLLWLLFPTEWTLPAFGFCVGYATNWLALWLIFEPKEPRRVLGLKVQGLFHQRQQDIAVEFADVVSSRIFNNENIIKEISSGPSRERLMEIVAAKADALIARYQEHPMAKMFAKPELIAALREDVLREVEGEIFREGSLIEKFVGKSEEIREALATNMAVMDSEDYENVLRPAFKQDEWKLIVAGAVLGGIIGFWQMTWYLVQ